ncbi:hypothetical protein QUB08_25035 [Microcoleus sp. BR0-C5]|uniref:hypothetical protein n=1 Tax=Microcoleus sp. BR0-C5 TaxID=2818713 RepID=UPI002FD09EF0
MSRPPFLDGRDAHPTITIKIVSYLIRDPKLIAAPRPLYKKFDRAIDPTYNYNSHGKAYK